ncbi:O-linked N-acetylglucosamine transferase, SPINDLY family protein [Trichocoleus desertorum AS-A10]|uniref:O-linked N-acetylglucosamine transferase, SPINDLY family protein n=1 Tax=Trichocoleus desertorum TaxID=1481672 RepID=UPI0032983354
MNYNLFIKNTFLRSFKNLMSSDYTSMTTVSLQQQAYQYLLRAKYSHALNLYEQAIEAEPSERSSYWYLGLVLLLQGKEEEAQASWFVPMIEAEPEQVEAWTAELLQVLQIEAERQETLENYELAWVLRQHIREIVPTNIDNLLKIVQLEIELNKSVGDDLESLQLLSLLKSEQSITLDLSLLLNTLAATLDYEPIHPATLQFAEACFILAHKPPISDDAQPLIDVLISSAIKIGYSLGQIQTAIYLAELCVRLNPNSLQPLGPLSAFYQKLGDYEKGIETAKRFCELAQSLLGQINGSYLLLRGLLSAGAAWQEAYKVFDHHQELLSKLIQQPDELSPNEGTNLFTSTFFFPYLQDDPQKNRWFHNQIGSLCQLKLQQPTHELVEHFHQRYAKLGSSPQEFPRPLRIGYISAYMKRHSVGWLARWLFQHHSSDRFQIYTYYINQPKEDLFTQKWFSDKAHQARYLGINWQEIAEQIHQDKIDILIDLDSITVDITSAVMALRPAPVQVTWLGWDASGIPAVDYFIADPYVLPQAAQEYYSEKILRLPQTYVAVDGFEVGIPTLRRDQLDIPNDAVVYLSAQKGHKRHPDTVRLQMKILKQVPNSYFLVKGLSDEKSIKNFFDQIAEEEGVDCDRLRFLPEVSAEAVHRANLEIADVVLDTYPYNGATTTLETLWMGIPLVTRVGQQFVSRNSYTMMMNVGVTEGLAWSDEEYIEWGIRLGSDAALRQQIAWRLKQSRQTSPLWNAKQFTRDMETAYEQIWVAYLEGHSL